MSNIKLSAIIPVYNNEKYLKKCLDSIINQTLKDIEIICINDGSKDDSLKILQDYSKKDNRIKIISTENVGAGAARNIGLKNVNGEYVAFIDSDDWIDTTAYETLYHTAKSGDLDLIFFSLKNYDNEKETFFKNYHNSISCLDNVENTIFNHNDISEFLFNIYTGPVVKLYKSYFLKEINVKFAEGMMFEDVFFFYKTILKAERISFIKKHFYVYRRHESSQTSRGTKKIIDIIRVYTGLLDLFEDEGFYEQYKKPLINEIIERIESWFSLINSEFETDFFNAMKKKIQKIDEDEKLSNDFNELLNPDNLIYYENVLKSTDYEEFKLLDENQKLNIENKKLNMEIRSLKIENEKFKSLYESVLSSSSWKITEPLRKIRKWLF